MHPAPSIIMFTALSGVGFGLLIWLGLGVPALSGWAAFWAFGLAYGLSVVGLISSTLHLGPPERALKAFLQWRSSWLSREGVVSVAALLVMAPFAFWRVFLVPGGVGGLVGLDGLEGSAGLEWLRWLGVLGAALSLLTVICTSMIYAQLKTVPRWNMGLVPVLFVLFSISGGALVTAPVAQTVMGTVVMLLVLTVLQWGYWRQGDRRFAAAGHSMETATGLGGIGSVRLLESPHSGTNYLLREMAFQIGRKHQRRLRLIAAVMVGLVPALLLVTVPLWWAGLAALGVHLVGLFASRWLFFAEAEHVVGLYYGKR
ncbi:MAG: DmsC/YnfH family molybdoenzyme membrane anchor subunit [Pseudomonadota bacterium]|nr:DmsC/YnfH family molybdoenzyme membrane anchor subunit [Pseudomonadota bacterium]